MPAKKTNLNNQTVNVDAALAMAMAMAQKIVKKSCKPARPTWI